MVYMGMRSRIKNFTRTMASTQMHAEYQKGPSELWAPTTELGRSTDPDIKDTMTKIFGDTFQIIPTMSHDLDARHELSHSTTGLKYAIRGRAQVIELTVGSRLAAFEDPIMAIMPVQVVDAHRVIVTTKEVVGGRSIGSGAGARADRRHQGDYSRGHARTVRRRSRDEPQPSA